MRRLANLAKVARAFSVCAFLSIAFASDLRLIEAAKDHNRKAENALLSEHVDVNAPQPDGATPRAWSIS